MRNDTPPGHTVSRSRGSEDGEPPARESATIAFRKRHRWKYLLHQDAVFATDIRPAGALVLPPSNAASKSGTQPPPTPTWVRLGQDGFLTVSAGYAWDGPSVVPDFRSLMRASLAHDALYQLLREVPDLHAQYPDLREQADRLFVKMAAGDGMWRVFERPALLALRMFGGRAAAPSLKTRP